MDKKFKKFGLCVVGVWSALVMGFATGCASGGFKMTREYARFVNRQNIILRIVLYILTAVVFAVTMVLDLVIFNTMDFWEGRVAQGTYHFEKDGATYVVHHRYLPGSGLRESRIEITPADGGPLKEIVLRETLRSEVEVYVDGQLHSRVSDISQLAPQSFAAAEPARVPSQS